MIRALSVVLLVLLAACGGNPGPQPPIPPIPPEPTSFFQEMLLRADGPSQFVDLEGRPVSFMGAISCCMPPDWGGGSGWPFNIDPAWQDYAAEQFGANFFHARSGPFMVPGEDEFLGIGGPYLAVDGEKVDLNQFNQPWWDLAGSWIKYAGERGRYVEVDLIDGWYCKHAEWGDVKMPWMAQWNIQGENHAAGCSAVEILPNSVYDNFVRKQVQEFGRFGNVIWVDGNEIGITGRYRPIWSLSLQARVRYWEQTVGQGFVHLFGTNSVNAEVRTKVDYVEEHSVEPMPSPLAGRLTLVNEYNPKPPFDAARMDSNRCYALRHGTFWWYWRHGQTKEQMEQTAALYRQACGVLPPTPPGCSFPQNVPESAFMTDGSSSTSLGTQVNAAMERITKCSTGSDCAAGTQADVFFDQVTSELRSTGLCAGRHQEMTPGASDEIAVGTSCEGWWESYHVYNYGGQKVVWSPNAARPRWKIDPQYCADMAPPPQAGECPLPHPELGRMKFSVSEKGGHLDTTWITVNQPEFCASIGYCCMPGTGVDNVCGSAGCIPRGGCPVRGEGNPDRPGCEAELCNQQWWCNGEPYPAYRGNPAQTDCRGHWKTCCSDMNTCAEGDR